METEISILLSNFYMSTSQKSELTASVCHIGRFSNSGISINNSGVLDTAARKTRRRRRRRKEAIAKRLAFHVSAKRTRKSFGNTYFFYKQPFVSNTRLKLAKNQANAKQDPEAEQFPFENYLLSTSTSSFKDNRRYSLKCTKGKYVCLNEVI